MQSYESNVTPIITCQPNLYENIEEFCAPYRIVILKTINHKSTQLSISYIYGF